MGTSQIRSLQNPENLSLPAAGRFFGDLWVPVSFLNFNVSDTLGRVVASWHVLDPRVAKLAAAARLVLGPLLLSCNVVASSTASANSGVLLDSDLWPLGLVAMLGMSYGYVASCVMMRGPKAVPDDRMASQAGTLM